MSGRLLALGIAVGCGAILLGLFQLYRRTAGTADRLDVTDLGLELMTGCCAFVVFTTPACRPCKAALRVVEAAIVDAPGTEVRTVDAIERSEMALRYEVRTIPTVFLITASGRVVARWRNVPAREEVDAALAAI